MKRTFLYAFGLSLLLWGCGGASSSPANAETDQIPSATQEPAADNAATESAPAEASPLLGSYVGSFQASKFHVGKNPSYANRINITIDEVKAEAVKGHSVVAGSIRPFTGTVKPKGEQFEIFAKEPGDDKYDGEFSFVINPAAKTATGTWVANDKKLSVYERSFELKGATFKYDPNLDLPEDASLSWLFSSQDEFNDMGEGEKVTDEAVRLNASKQKLKKEDIENMFKGDLEILRNSIYARHGYTFKNRKMRYFFDNAVPWYIPMSTDVSKELTKLEEENIALIKRYEQHADTYYDGFGR